METDHRTPRLIVADDNVDGALSLAELLEPQMPPGASISVVHDGLAAVEAALAEPPPGAVVLDIEMPRMSGIEAAAAIRRSQAPGWVPVLVAMSGNDELLECARRSGHFQAVLRKPIDFKALLEVL